MPHRRFANPGGRGLRDGFFGKGHETRAELANPVREAPHAAEVGAGHARGASGYRVYYTQ